MEPILLKELPYKQKLQYAESRIKQELQLSQIRNLYLPLSTVFIFFIYMIALLCIFPDISDAFVLLPGLVCAIVVLVFAIRGYQQREHALNFYDKLVENRVWYGCIDTFHVKQKYEFIDKNNQSVTKAFVGKPYAKYIDKQNVYVIFIPKLDLWHLELTDILTDEGKEHL